MDSLKGVDGLICIGKFSPIDLAKFREITSRLVVVDMQFDLIKQCHIIPDFKSAIKEVVDEFIEHHHTHLGYLGGKEILDNKRYFVAYCKEKHIQDIYIDEDTFDISSGYAMGALKAITDMGLKVPDDITLVGFNNIQLVNYTNPRFQVC